MTKLLTKIGDKLGLVRDKQKPTQTDGITHLYIGLCVHAVVSVVVWSYFYNLYALLLANWIVLAIMTVIFVIGEHRQEKALVRKYPDRKYSWRPSRKQDVLVYALPVLIILISVSVAV